MEIQIKRRQVQDFFFPKKGPDTKRMRSNVKRLIIALNCLLLASVFYYLPRHSEINISARDEGSPSWHDCSVRCLPNYYQLELEP